MNNILTVDVEGWESALSGLWGEIVSADEKVLKNLYELLEIFEKYNAKGTFFFLGEVAEKFPSLLKDVLNCGNEIAYHGYYHRDLSKISFDELKEELKKGKDIIEQIIGKKIIGFRAPNFTLMKCKSDIFDLLLDLGFKYDSSIFPYKKYNGFFPEIKTHFLKTPSKREIFEVPLSVISIFGFRIPCLGGAFFRNYPFFMTKFAIKKIQKEKRQVVFYIHPHEFEDINFKNLNIKVNFLRKFLEKRGRKKVKFYLENLLERYKFDKIEKIYENEIGSFR